jgi:hypothetical protein
MGARCVLYYARLHGRCERVLLIEGAVSRKRASGCAGIRSWRMGVVRETHASSAVGRPWAA